VVDDQADLRVRAKAFLDGVGALANAQGLTRAQAISLFGLFGAQVLAECASAGLDPAIARDIVLREFLDGLDTPRPSPEAH
jgi:hypothetical protein